MMQIWKSIKYVSLLILGLAMISCDSDYTTLVKDELSKDKRQDSLLLGVRFGNTREEFYGRCFDLNKQKIVTQGVGFSVLYIVKDSVTQTPTRDINLQFYPKFDSMNYIKGMDMEFFYTAWTAENPALQSDSLQTHVIGLLKNWYKGNDFMTIKVDEKDVKVKIDANRRIMVKLEDEQRVLVHVQDLVHKDYRHNGVDVNESLERKRH